MAARQSVVIHAPGQSEVRVIVPAFEPEGGDVVAEAVTMLRSLVHSPSCPLIAHVFSTDDVTDVEIKK